MMLSKDDKLSLLAIDIPRELGALDMKRRAAKGVLFTPNIQRIG